MITEEDLTERERFWLAQGYVSVRIAAERTRRHVATIYRAIRAAELESKVDGKHKFVSMKSLIAWIGTDTARMYGLLPKKS